VTVDVTVDLGPLDSDPVDVGPLDAGPTDAGGADAAMPGFARRSGRLSTLGVRAWQSGGVRIVDDELEASPRLCGGSGAGFFCVSGGFVR
jgi:hypothetical protein